MRGCQYCVSQCYGFVDGHWPVFDGLGTFSVTGSRAAAVVDSRWSDDYLAEDTKDKRVLSSSGCVRENSICLLSNCELARFRVWKFSFIPSVGKWKLLIKNNILHNCGVQLNVSCISKIKIYRNSRVGENFFFARIYKSLVPCKVWIKNCIFYSLFFIIYSGVRYAITSYRVFSIYNTNKFISRGILNYRWYRKAFLKFVKNEFFVLLSWKILKLAWVTLQSFQIVKHETGNQPARSTTSQKRK